MPKPKRASLQAPPTQSLAEKYLRRLPKLDAVRREAYTEAFSPQQCVAWGRRTRAAVTYADADRVIGVVAPWLLEHELLGYSAARLSWLCTCAIELHRLVREYEAETLQAEHARTRRLALYATAVALRKRLRAGLLSAAGSDARRRKDVAAATDRQLEAHSLERTLSNLLQLVLHQRKSASGAVLLEDAGVTDDLLDDVRATCGELRGLSGDLRLTLRTNDSEETNLAEGRVLRELAFLRNAVLAAKRDGAPVPAFPFVRSLRKPRSAQRDDDGTPQ